MKIFNLYYYVSNGGDGSVSVHAVSTEEEAKKEDENLDEGWGEPCNGEFELSIIDGKIHRRHVSWDSGKREESWIPLEQS